MTLPVAEKAIDFIFTLTPPNEKIDIGFFGGEPLLEFELLKKITALIEKHPSFNGERVELSVVTNGTVFSDEIAEYLMKHNIGFCVSCDGPPIVQNVFRCFPDGRGSSSIVGKTLSQAVNFFPSVLVNAVYHPKTLDHLPLVVEYFSLLGLKQIYLNPDFSASWSKKEADSLPGIYDRIGKRYIEFYQQKKPHYISLIDGKIAVILRGGYKPQERCRMGTGEFAFAPSGNIYPCERLIGDGTENDHCIGNIHHGLNARQTACKAAAGQAVNAECASCGFKDYCMNWCGCSNYFSSGHYNRVGPFLCASEKVSISTAYTVIQALEKKHDAVFAEHVSGVPPMNSMC